MPSQVKRVVFLPVTRIMTECRIVAEMLISFSVGVTKQQLRHQHPPKAFIKGNRISRLLLRVGSVTLSDGPLNLVIQRPKTTDENAGTIANECSSNDLCKDTTTRDVGSPLRPSVPMYDLSEMPAGSARTLPTKIVEETSIFCHCNEPAQTHSSIEEGCPGGRQFYRCSMLSGKDCCFFKWCPDSLTIVEGNESALGDNGSYAQDSAASNRCENFSNTASPEVHNPDVSQSIPNSDPPPVDTAKTDEQCTESSSGSKAERLLHCLCDKPAKKFPINTSNRSAAIGTTQRQKCKFFLWFKNDAARGASKDSGRDSKRNPSKESEESSRLPYNPPSYNSSDIASDVKTVFFLSGANGNHNSTTFERIPAYDIVVKEWNHLCTLPDPLEVFPAPRKNHGITQTRDYDTQAYHVHSAGGFNEKEAHNDLWRLDLSNLQWTCVLLNTPISIPVAPKARESFSQERGQDRGGNAVQEGKRRKHGGVTPDHVRIRNLIITLSVMNQSKGLSHAGHLIWSRNQTLANHHEVTKNHLGMCQALMSRAMDSRTVQIATG
ncbi:hypothetical protein QAD02_021224 [Eretmocerus hayati]|uniref:Uncharacterized protein n=1 Tax=Eretmocerus hayati TaxID=131215 RepID=A0ACC2PPL0_9HYME|nr:hypothetical protein QAD02_021224 [Eretmocerus hayati]